LHFNEKLYEHPAQNNGYEKSGNSRSKRTERYVFKNIERCKVAFEQVKKIKHRKNYSLKRL
jgi:hypothetical protein